VCVGVQGAAPSRPQQDHRDTNPEVRRLGHRHRPSTDGQEKQIVLEACPPDPGASGQKITRSRGENVYRWTWKKLFFARKVSYRS
jgi:hypothetical protein